MKQKHWQVSVFDRSIETIKDDPFYTTDTEVYLVFELIDKNFTPDLATVSVYNDYGKATIHESVEVVGGIVRYKIPAEAIRHSGDWRTQVVFTKENEDYTTGVIEFDVGGHLLGNKKPTITISENWNSFMKHARELIDDWEQLEEIRQANEQVRESAESVRVANEAERISKDSERGSKIDEIEVNLESKANKKQEEWITPTLQNGATIPSEHNFQFRKDEFGNLQLFGRVTLPDSAATLAFRLPIGYRPLERIVYIFSDDVQGGKDFVKVLFHPDGWVQCYGSNKTIVFANTIPFGDD